MGIVTIFAIDDCPHCRRAKGTLKENGIDYREISLTLYPDRRNDMLSLTDRLTVPQIFFAGKYVGGADETIEKITQWENDKTKTVKEHYEAEFGSSPDPTDERLKESTGPPVEQKQPPPRDESDKIKLPDGSLSSVLDLTEKLKEILPHKDKKYQLKIYKKSFTGKEAIRVLMQEISISEEEAVAFGRSLNDQHMLYHVVHEHAFLNTDDYFYRLQCYQNPEILNSYRLWKSVVDPDSVGLVIRLKKLLGKVESAVTNEKGEVDYRNAHKNEHYPVFEEAVCELQKINLARLGRNALLAFGINLYNLMIKYAFMKVGVGNTDLARASFFTGVKFNVGGDMYSFQDLENGILRGNRKAPYALVAQIGRNDPRLPLVMQQVDCRIHFALNCGAKSCPPVKSFTAEGVEEELRIVSMAFCEDDNNVEVDDEQRTLSLSKIFSWYRADFAPSNKELPMKVVDFLRGEKKAKLQKMLDEEGPISISFKPYDWGTHASDFVPFDSNVLKADVYSLVALW